MPRLTRASRLALPVSFAFLLAPLAAEEPRAPAPPPGGAAAALQPFVDRHTLAGAVTLVASKDKVLSLESVGFADIAANKPMRMDALFRIASQSKPMTAAALMMLVDEGKVSVHDPVEKYLPEFMGLMVAVERDAEHVLLRKPTHPVKVREILSHTSGMPFKSPMEDPTLDGLPLRDAVRSHALVPLQWEPGSKYQYSTAADVAQFCRMVLNGGTLDGKRLLSEAAVTQMTTQQTGEAIKDGYGFGWAVHGGGFGHGGAHSTDMTIDPKRGLITVFMVQHAGFPGDGKKSLAAFRQAAEQQFGKRD